MRLTFRPHFYEPLFFTLVRIPNRRTAVLKMTEVGGGQGPVSRKSGNLFGLEKVFVRL